MAFFGTPNKNYAGSFTEISCGNHFEFAKTENEWALQHNLPYEIAVHWHNHTRMTEVRYARILKTCIYVAVDENDEGPVLEKWNIKKLSFKEA